MKFIKKGFYLVLFAFLLTGCSLAVVNQSTEGTITTSDKFSIDKNGYIFYYDNYDIALENGTHVVEFWTPDEQPIHFEDKSVNLDETPYPLTYSKFNYKVSKSGCYANFSIYLRDDHVGSGAKYKFKIQ
jgi:hypothetical protein